MPNFHDLKKPQFDCFKKIGDLLSDIGNEIDDFLDKLGEGMSLDDLKLKFKLSDIEIDEFFKKLLLPNLIYELLLDPLSKLLEKLNDIDLEILQRIRDIIEKVKKIKLKLAKLKDFNLDLDFDLDFDFDLSDILLAPVWMVAKIVTEAIDFINRGICHGEIFDQLGRLLNKIDSSVFDYLMLLDLADIKELIDLIDGGDEDAIRKKLIDIKDTVVKPALINDINNLTSTGITKFSDKEYNINNRILIPNTDINKETLISKQVDLQYTPITDLFDNQQDIYDYPHDNYQDIFECKSNITFKLDGSTYDNMTRESYTDYLNTQFTSLYNTLNFTEDTLIINDIREITPSLAVGDLAYSISYNGTSDTTTILGLSGDIANKPIEATAAVGYTVYRKEKIYEDGCLKGTKVKSLISGSSILNSLGETPDKARKNAFDNAALSASANIVNFKS